MTYSTISDCGSGPYEDTRAGDALHDEEIRCANDPGELWEALRRFVDRGYPGSDWDHALLSDRCSLGIRLAAAIEAELPDLAEDNLRGEL